jgi:small subunit ribosomal protein S7
MPRRGAVKKRESVRDRVYNSEVIAKLINAVMLDGKKSLAQKIVYESLDRASSKSGLPTMEMFSKVMENVAPSLEVKARRVGGATYQVPMEVKAHRRQALALRWIVDFSRKRSEKTMVERLSNELVDALNSTGASVKKREDTHKMAEANKAFAHYRW